MSRWLIFGIVVLAFFLRVPYLGLYPIGFTPDEASFGYDAYSILHTGRDQWGHTLPLVLESFGDFKAPLYTYLAVPFVALFGLNEMSVRLPNALLGVGAVWLVYLLVTELLNNQFIKQNKWPTSNIGIIGALLLAISPWHIELSRGAFEANMITSLLPLTILLFLKSIRRQKFLPWSSFVFGLSLFSYHSAKVVVPLVFGFLILLYWKELKLPILKQKKKEFHLSRKVIMSAFIFGIFLLLTVMTFLQGAGRRASDVSIFNGALEAQADARSAAIQNGTNPTVARLLHNKYFVTVDRFFDNYTSYFSPNFLFENGPREGTYGMMPRLPVMYWFELPLLLLFVFFLIRNKKEKYAWFILFWFLVAPIPASLTQGVGHAANRAATMVPVLQIAGALGFLYFLSIMNSHVRRVAGVIFVCIALFSSSSFAKTYFLYSPYVLAKSMLYGNMEVAQWLQKEASDKTNIIVSNKLSEPHIYIAFVNKWNPKEYQKSTEDWSRYKDEGLTFLDQLYSYRLGKYVFKHIDKEDLVGLENTILVGRPEEFPDSMEVIKRFMYPDGTVSIVVVAPFKDTYAYIFEK